MKPSNWDGDHSDTGWGRPGQLGTAPDEPIPGCDAVVSSDSLVGALFDRFKFFFLLGGGGRGASPGWEYHQFNHFGLQVPPTSRDNYKKLRASQLIPTGRNLILTSPQKQSLRPGRYKIAGKEDAAS